MKKIFTILLLSGSLLMSGCSDWLDILPKDKQSTDMYWESSEDVEAILAQGYSRLRTCVQYINCSVGYLLPSDRYGECCVKICTDRDGQRCKLL